MKYRIVFGVILASFLHVASLSAETIPLENFFKNPQFSGLQLSPDGENLAALANVGGRMNVVVMNLETRKPQVITSEREQDVSGFMWANNDRLLFFMDKDGSESFGIFAVNKDGSKPKILVKPLGLQVAANGPSQYPHRFGSGRAAQGS